MNPTLFLIQLSGVRFEAVLMDADTRFKLQTTDSSISGIDLDVMEFATDLKDLAQSDTAKLFLIPRQYRSSNYKGKSFSSLLGAPEAVYMNCKDVPDSVIRKIAVAIFKRRPVSAANVCAYNLRRKDLANFVLSSKALQNPDKAIEAILGDTQSEEEAEKPCEDKVLAYSNKKTLMNLMAAIIEHKALVNPYKSKVITQRAKAETTDWQGETVDIVRDKLYRVEIVPNRSRANLNLMYAADAILTQPNGKKHVVRVYRNLSIIRDGKLNMPTLVTSKELLPYLDENGYVYKVYGDEVHIPLCGLDIVSQEDLKPNDFDGIKAVYMNAYRLKAELEVIRFILSERNEDKLKTPSPYYELSGYGVDANGFYKPKTVSEPFAEPQPYIEVPSVDIAVEGYATLPTQSYLKEALQRTPKVPGTKLQHEIYEELKAEKTFHLIEMKREKDKQFALATLELGKVVTEILLFNNLATAAMTWIKPRHFKADNGLVVKFKTIHERVN